MTKQPTPQGITYPDCSGCGHNASGVVAFRCTTFVAYPEGDPRGGQGGGYAVGDLDLVRSFA